MDIWDVDLDKLSHRELRKLLLRRKREVARLDSQIRRYEMQYRRVRRFWEIFLELRVNINVTGDS